MFSNGRKTIGVFISQANDDYQDALIRGISSRAKELDYNVAFFTNFGGYGQPAYDMGEKDIANIPSYEDFDGIILAMNTISIHSMNTCIRKSIRNYSKCPVVSVQQKMNEYYNVLIDDNKVLEELINHFIKVHSFTKYNFMAGPKGLIESEKRLQTFLRILGEHNIPIEEERIYYGDFSKSDGYRAVDKWLSAPLEKPQAIICVNDLMAMSICNALEERGISVPEDIAVTGCDDIDEAAEFSPSLTSVKLPVFEMGRQAVVKIKKHNMGIEQSQNSYLKTVTVYRESCGCKKDWYKENHIYRKNHVVIREAIKKEILGNSYMATDLNALTKLEQINEKIKIYVNENLGYSKFCMCLKDDWDIYHEDEKVDEAFTNDTMTMTLGIRNGVSYTNITFPRRELIPSEFVEDQPMIYFFAMLHHLENSFGYVAISFDRIQTYMLTFHAWLINISHALESVRVRMEMKRLVAKMEDMSIRDELTELYNRRGLDVFGQKYLGQCIKEHLRFMILTADLDRLKYINDTFGHVKGDMAISVVANALRNAAEHEEVCVRYGGDEFIVVGKNYSESKMKKFINKLEEGLNMFNNGREHEFEVTVSYGWSITMPDEDTTVEKCLVVADFRMYKQKYEKKALSKR
jgi:diguanylate cyclase (GGDEF)-like protein